MHVGVICDDRYHPADVIIQGLAPFDAADQKKTADFEIARMRGVDSVAVRFERCPRSVERFRGPAQVARNERNFRLGNHTPRAGYGLFWSKGSRGTPTQ